jgi:hypothetical protein
VNRSVVAPLISTDGLIAFMAGFYPDKGRSKTPETLLSEANRFAPNEHRSLSSAPPPVPHRTSA